MLTVAISIAVLVRLGWQRSYCNQTQRWRQVATAFLLPPLCLVTTAIAILAMGTDGTMIGVSVGHLGYLAAIASLIAAVGALLVLSWNAQRALNKIRALPKTVLDGQVGYQLNTDVPYAAQVGFWRSDLVVSQGLIDNLSSPHLRAVLVHEQAHETYHDTFWFFLLGWLRQTTGWLPKTDELWQELLLLRELRADRWAAQRVDPLILAEALLAVVHHQAITQVYPMQESYPCAAFDSNSVERLEERVEALLDPCQEVNPSSTSPWLTPLIATAALAPILTVFLHH